MIRAAVLLCLPTALWAQCKLPPLPGSSNFPGSVIRWCPPAQPLSLRGSAAVLVDDSASMIGFGKPLVERFAFWVNQSLSQVRQRGFQWDETRGCYFSAGNPLKNCRTAQIAPASFRGARDTSLHEAIDHARNFQLAVILTDGSSAAGGNSGDCASGADAACIARALANTLEPRSGEPKTLTPGIWILPLIAAYDGKFFTEQPIAPGEFDPAKAVASSTAESKIRTGVENPVRGYQGLLEYKYTGPRGLYAIVLSRNVELGRAMAGAMMSRRSFSKVGYARRWTDFEAGLAAMDPIEIFPGLSPTVQWASATGAERACRTFDLTFRETQELTINCPNDVDRTIVTVRSRPQAAGSECVAIQNLPVTGVKARTNMPASAVEDFRWTGFLMDEKQPLTLHLQLQCRKSWRFNSWLVWAQSRDFAASASRMASNRAVTPAEQAVFALSASEVAYQPNRIFQLREMIEKFYRNVGAVPSPPASEFGKLAITKP